MHYAYTTNSNPRFSSNAHGLPIFRKLQGKPLITASIQRIPLCSSIAKKKLYGWCFYPNALYPKYIKTLVGTLKNIRTIYKKVLYFLKKEYLHTQGNKLSTVIITGIIQYPHTNKCCFFFLWGCLVFSLLILLIEVFCYMYIKGIICQFCVNETFFIKKITFLFVANEGFTKMC